MIIWNKKTQGNDNQLWSYEGGFITNKNSGLVLEVSGYGENSNSCVYKIFSLTPDFIEDGGQITPGAPLVQAAKREQPKSLNQLWAYNYKHLMPYDPKVSVAVEGNNVTTAGSNAIVARFNFEDQRQMWNFERA